jgi:hypothetical protein
MELELVPKDAPVEKDVSNTPQDGPLKYTGPDRRKAPRRITVDRREMVRFENKPDRRQNGDRRLQTRMWDGRDF